MDISDTLAPNSEQLDAVELVGGDRIFTIERITKGNAEQPINIFFADFPRPWRPGKSMRRVLAHAWGTDASVWIGRRVELFCDPAIVFGGKAVGGTRVRRLSHIDKPVKTPLIVTRGRSEVYTVDPLPDAPAQQPSPVAALLAEIKQAADAKGIDLATVAQEWKDSHDGQDIRQATDVGGLELLAADIRARSEA